MPPRLLGLAALLSLLLCVATLAWWARSFLPPDLHVGAADGRLVLVFADAPLTRQWQARSTGRVSPVSAAELWNDARRGRSLQPTTYFVPAGSAPGAPARLANKAPLIETSLGVTTATEPGPFAAHYRLVAIPLLYFAAVLAVPPLAWLVRSLRGWRRAGAGACARCGYDLRGTPERCPECGTAAAAGTMATP